METLLKADIFFFVSTIATVILTTLLSIALWYIIKTVRIIYRAVNAIDAKIHDSEEFIQGIVKSVLAIPLVRAFIPRKRKK